MVLVDIVYVRFFAQGNDGLTVYRFVFFFPGEKKSKF